MVTSKDICLLLLIVYLFLIFVEDLLIIIIIIVIITECLASWTRCFRIELSKNRGNFADAAVVRRSV